MTITWFRHHHENRNDLLRFGLMRLHYSGALRYVEKPLSDALSYGFARAIVNYPDLRHKSFLLVEQGQRLRCMVDSEDSFALISPLLAEVDVCFCAGYNTDFFERKQFVQNYHWQTENDLAWYRRTIVQKIDTIGDEFYKVKRFVPIAPNLSYNFPIKPLVQKFRNLSYRLNRMTGRGNPFSDVYKGFELRYAYLQALRQQLLRYDITLHDSLWGWPQHRINLHRQLASLHIKGYKVHSVLNWTEPVESDGSRALRLDKTLFPMKTGPITGSYEEMLAQSRLAVFACGFHWGWRNIMMFALMMGIPVITDRLLTEAYFDMNEFRFTQQEDHLWSAIETKLNEIDEEKWNEIKLHNQGVYDTYMSPESVGRYFIETLNR